MFASYEMSTESFISAVSNGDILAVKKLLDQGADINAKSKDSSKTPALSVAIIQGNVDVAYLLIERGADIHALDGVYATPLIWASWLGESSIVKLLLEYGANPNVSDSLGETPLLNAIRFIGEEINTNKYTPTHARVAKLLILYGASEYHIKWKG